MTSGLQPGDSATLEKITLVHQWTDSLYSFRTTRSEDFRFTAGQYARLGIEGDEGLVWRAFSLTSAENDSFLEFYVVDVEGGAFTSRLKLLKPGDNILVGKQSYGFMTADSFADGADLWMLATGTGLGPFVSILQNLEIWRKFSNLILVHSVRTAEEFAYQDQLLALKQREPYASLPANLRLIQTTTREPARQNSQYLHGRITALLQSGELERQAGIAIHPDTSRIMLCGNPEMISDTRVILRERGLLPCRRAAPGQFIAENYW